MATIATSTRRKGSVPTCPFQSTAERRVACNKAGGVCTLRLYEWDDDTKQTSVVVGSLGGLRTVCPQRFEEDRLIYRWVGETLLRNSDPTVVGEVGFLERVRASDEEEEVVAGKDDVGRIDKVLVVPNSSPLQWCALEKQAVYFSGDSMSREWPAISAHQDTDIPFPVGKRRPDYRSSGPKRLMPQLQTKVPSLRRWGKKMGVVVDEDFWKALGPMDQVSQVSNCDIAWFIVGYEAEQVGTSLAQYRLVLREVRLTTLERAVEGLTAGLPVGLEEFERRILNKLK